MILSSLFMSPFSSTVVPVLPQIGAITGLSHLVNLKRLDLSFNKIRKIEGLAELFSLQYLDLRANAISSVNDVDELKLVRNIIYMCCSHDAVICFTIRTRGCMCVVVTSATDVASTI